jgi:hypothetical protein
MSIRETLTKARALIADPTHWTEGTFARKSDGIETGWLDPEACCFCAEGAIMKACEVTFQSPNRMNYTAYREAMDFLQYNHVQKQAGLPTEMVPAINDDLGHEAVIKLFDKGIELAPN